MKNALRFILEHMIPDLPEHKVMEAKGHLESLDSEEGAPVAPHTPPVASPVVTVGTVNTDPLTFNTGETALAAGLIAGSDSE